MVRRRCRLPSTSTSTCSTPVKALSAMPQTTLGVELGAKAPPPFVQNEAVNGSNKVVEVHLIKTLENIIQVQKTFQSLTSDNATKALSTCSPIEIPTQIEMKPKTKARTKTKNENKSVNKNEKNRVEKVEVHKDMGMEQWQEYLVTAFKNHDKKLAQDLVNATPDNIKDAVDPTLLRNLGNIILRLNKEHDRDLAFQIFRRMEDLRPHLKFTGEEDNYRVRSSVHQTRLTAIRRVLKFLLHNPRDIPAGPYMGMVRTMRHTILNLPESDPNLQLDNNGDTKNNRQDEETNVHAVDEDQLRCAIVQHEFYPKLMRSLLRYGATNNVRKSAAWRAMELDVWDEALYHFRGNFQRDILGDGSGNRNEHGHYAAKKGGFVLASYEKILESATYRNQKLLPFPYMLRLVIMAGTQV